MKNAGNAVSRSVGPSFGRTVQLRFLLEGKLSISLVERVRIRLYTSVRNAVWVQLASPVSHEIYVEGREVP